MGLDTTHGAFHGAYSAFDRLRRMICRAAGGSYPPHDDMERLLALEVKNAKHDWWYVPDDVTPETHPGLYVFLKHSDCDGELTPSECALVAKDLEALLPKIAEMDDGDVRGGWSLKRSGEGIEVGNHPGHLARVGGYVGATKKFIDGCRLAAENGETLLFQ